jgi:hypothetical protein
MKNFTRNFLGLVALLFTISFTVNAQNTVVTSVITNASVKIYKTVANDVVIEQLDIRLEKHGADDLYLTDAKFFKIGKSSTTLTDFIVFEEGQDDGGFTCHDEGGNYTDMTYSGTDCYAQINDDDEWVFIAIVKQGDSYYGGNHLYHTFYFTEYNLAFYEIGNIHFKYIIGEIAKGNTNIDFTPNYSVACPQNEGPPLIYDCYLNCVSANFLGNETCHDDDDVANFDCSYFNYDEGDCPGPIGEECFSPINNGGPGEGILKFDCQGVCYKLNSWEPNNYCHDGSNGGADLFCEEFFYDLGDCVGPPSGICGNIDVDDGSNFLQQQFDCNSECSYLEFQIGDETCHDGSDGGVNLYCDVFQENYEPCKTGCMDEDACNYDESATSHLYIEEEDMCWSSLEPISNLKVDYIADRGMLFTWDYSTPNNRVDDFNIYQKGSSSPINSLPIQNIQYTIPTDVSNTPGEECEAGGGDFVTQYDCDGNCFMGLENNLGDGTCHDDGEYINLNCSAFDYDAGDCTPIFDLDDNTLVIIDVNGTVKYRYLYANGFYANCTTYEYQISSVGGCQSSNEYAMSTFKAVLVDEEVENTWVNESLSDSASMTEKILSASKGDYEDRIELSWENNNNPIIATFEILRREMSDAGNDESGFVKIAETTYEVHHYIDLYCEAQLLYEYKVVAKIPACTTESSEDEFDERESNISVGFRSPSSDIQGQVAFDGAIAVVGAKVYASTNNLILNKSLILDGENDPLVFAFPQNSSSFSIMSWVNQDDISDVAETMNLFNMANFSAEIDVNNNLLINEVIVENEMPLSGSWYHVSVTYSSSGDLKVYVNGVFVSESTIELTNATQNLTIGGDVSNRFKGKLDEISIWDTALDSAFIAANYNTYINTNNENLISYYHCDEGVGNFIYDFSLNNKYISDTDFNNAPFFNNKLALSAESMNFSNQTPSTEQMSYFSVSDELGYFTIEDIRYPFSGATYQVTPTLAAKYSTDSNDTVILLSPAHEFSPTSSSAFLGDGIDFLSNYNFTDISAFDVSGQIIFEVHENMLSVGDTTYNIPVEGVKILVDGEEQNNSEGEVQLTDSEGNFTVSVPIGAHTLSFEKDGHEFEYRQKGVESTTGFYDFGNSDDKYQFVQNLNINDVSKIVCTSTKDLIVRVTGGLKHQDIDLGWAEFAPDGEQVNTIGQVTFNLIPEGDDVDNGSGHKVTITTDVLTGEMVGVLLPIKYRVLRSTFDSSNDDVVTEYDSDSGYVFDLIDMNVTGSASEEEGFVEDLFTSIKPGADELDEGGYAEEDIKKYHNSFDLIYRVNPEIMVSQKIEESPNLSSSTFQDFLGVTQVTAEDGAIIDLNLADEVYPFGSPVFTPLINEIYSIRIGVVEQYMNHGPIITETEDTFVQTLIPVTEGFVTINNTMLSSPTSQMELSETAELIYHFNPDNPHVFGIEEEYKRSLVIDYQNGSINNSYDLDVILLGMKSFGNDFFTFGPQVVDMVVRDPNGDASYSWLEQGTTLARSTSITSADGVAQEFAVDLSLGVTGGTEHYVGGIITIFGVGVSTQVLAADVEAAGGIQSNITNTSYVFKSRENQFIQEEVFSTSIGTSGDEFNIGHSGDVFIGESKNMIFGTAKALRLIDTAKCEIGGGIYECSDLAFGDYKLGTKTMPSIAPGTNTSFAFTTNYIENYLIPKLMFIRNSYIIGVYDYDESIVPTDHECFGEHFQSACFESPLAEAYYTIPESFSEDVFDIPDLVSYTGEIQTQIFDATRHSYNKLFDDVEGSFDHFFNGNNDLTLTSIHDVISTGYIGVGFSVDNFNDQEDTDNFISEFCEQVDIANTPGFIGLNNLWNPEQSSDNQIIIPADKALYYNQQINQWLRALALNELDKIQDNTVTNNHSISPGVEIETTMSSVAAFSSINSIGYFIESSGGLGIYGNWSGSIFGVGVETEGNTMNSWTTEFEFETSTELYSEFENVLGYYLSDDDQGDIISLNVEESNFGFGPIFKTIAGATSCPWEDENRTHLLHKLDFNNFYEFTKAYYHNINPNLSDSELADEVQSSYNQLFEGVENDQVMSETTSQRDKPTINVSPYNLYNVPEQEQAVFTITLGNESETGDDMVYTLRVDEASNPSGAIITIDGQSVLRDIMVPAGGLVTKTVTVEKGPIELSYENLGLILHSSCQYDFGTSNGKDIADSVYFSVHFLPTCTDVDFSGLNDNWVINTNDTNEDGDVVMDVSLRDYNPNYYSLQELAFQYRNSNGGDWQQPASFENLDFVSENYYFKHLSGFDLGNLISDKYIDSGDTIIWDDLLSSSNEASLIIDWYNKVQPVEKCFTSKIIGQTCEMFTAIYEDQDSISSSRPWWGWSLSDYGEVPDDSDTILTSVTIANQIEYLQDLRTDLIEKLVGNDKNYISTTNLKTEYSWELPAMDGTYEIRAKTYCGKYTSMSGELENVDVFSDVYAGIVDRIRPEPFGAAQPADGILSPNDEIQMNWSEPIDANRFYSPQTNISMHAIKNMSEISHDAFVYIDSVSSLEIPYGLNLQNSSFTVEMWINPKSSGTLFEQGYENNRLRLFLTANNTLGIEYEISGELVTSTSESVLALATEDTDAWQHVAFVFDNDQKTISFIINGTLIQTNDAQSFLCDYAGEGAILIGNEGYDGSIHELRIWSSNKYATSIYQSMQMRLSGSEAGLQGYWPLDELVGVPQDLSRSRHMTGDVHWAVTKKGFGYDFLSNSILNAPFGTKAYEATDDFTLEFWFKSNGTSECMVSTGSYKPEMNAGNLDAWSVGLDAQGRISIEHNLNNENTVLMSSSELFNDATWHHIALVKNAKSNTTLFVDGIERASCSSELTRGFGSPQLTLGAKQYRNTVEFEYSEYFSGKIDEFRLWHLKRNFSQLNRFRNIRLEGTELGLDVYYPFEKHENIQLIESFLDAADSLHLELDTISDASYESSDLPLIRMSNPYLSVSHSALVNQDQTLLSITEELAAVEGTVVDVTMDNLFDLYGNRANPVTWSFYVDKNQLVWDKSVISLEKVLGESAVFETIIMNHGGTLETYEITNLPNWLTASPAEGVLAPNSYAQISFVVDENLFIGDYSEQLILTGNNGVSEMLKLDVNVEALQPDFLVTSQDYQFDMSFIGKVSVSNIRSRDELDVLVAYVNDEPRGSASPIYIEDYDAYFIFLTVYSNENEGDEISFRLWDASEGKMQSQVKINGETQILFYDGSIVGNLVDLTVFEADNTLRQEIYLAEGWNWFSLNLDANDGANIAEVLLPTVTQNLNDSLISVFKGQSAYAQYSEVYGWYGTLTSVELGDMYMMKIAEKDTLVYEGIPVDLNNTVYNIAIVEGWNWIGYLGQRPLNINEALSSVNSTSGDLIKSKSNFSIYASESIGWLGTLDVLKEGEGYMLKSAEDHTLIYPESSLYGSGTYRINGNQYPKDLWEVDPNKYEGSMSIIAHIDHPDYLNPNLENILGAFKGSECVGNISATLIASEASMYFITVYGKPNDLIQFEYYDEQKAKTYKTENSLAFENNSTVGSLAEPYAIHIDVQAQDAEVYFDCMVYPNPFEEEFVLEYMLDTSEEVEISIYDVMGRFVKTIFKNSLESGFHNHVIDASELTKGYYFIEIKCGEISHHKSIIKS